MPTPPTMFGQKLSDTKSSGHHVAQFVLHQEDLFIHWFTYSIDGDLLVPQSFLLDRIIAFVLVPGMEASNPKSICAQVASYCQSHSNIAYVNVYLYIYILI